jgi:hypothetical protein
MQEELQQPYAQRCADRHAHRHRQAGPASSTGKTMTSVIARAEGASFLCGASSTGKPTVAVGARAEV